MDGHNEDLLPFSALVRQLQSQAAGLNFELRVAAEESDSYGKSSGGAAFVVEIIGFENGVICLIDVDECMEALRTQLACAIRAEMEERGQKRKLARKGVGAQNTTKIGK